MDVLREREEKDNLERQLLEEQKTRVLAQKRLRREKRARRHIQQQLDLENKRRAQLEEALRAVGASDQVTAINKKLSQTGQKPPTPSIAPATSSSTSIISQLQPNMNPTSDRDRLLEPPRPVERIKQEREDTQSGYGQPTRDIREPPPPSPQDNKPWGYSGMEMMNTGAAFWQNYSGEFHNFAQFK
ncbi:hypothetical protein JTB14_001074 [Gonioctena quinquepunctata]|nr:hypothetical protein JTB14_001074 [Gonioctena quinquepunctata]